MPPRRRKHTIRQCLFDLDVDDASVFESSANSREEEFKVIKKIYFRKVLQCHPDKGGDPEVFRTVQTSFDLLRNLHNGGKGGNWLFVECMTTGSSNAAARVGASAGGEDGDEEEYDMADYDDDFSNMETPSWEYYQQAAEETVPIYKVELAKSGRSKCKQKGAAKRCFVTLPEPPSATAGTLVDLEVEFIQKDEVRIGSMNLDSGSYGRWCHLRCWRVPHKVWLGLPDPAKCQDLHQFELALARMNEVLLSGFSDLPPEEKQSIVRYVMDTDNWAKARQTKAPASSKTASKSDTGASVSTGTEEDSKMPAARASTASTGTVVAAGKQRFVCPVPGQNGAQPNAFAGKTFVLTGLFPEMGGGAGLGLGKEKTKAMIISFGGRVTGSVSGKTDVLVVGKEPGMSKVSQARAKDKVLLVGLMDLKQGLDDGKACLEDFAVFSKEEPMKIKDFSMGYAKRSGYNGLALTASKKDLAIAQGAVQKKKRSVASLESGPAALDNDGEQKPAAKKRKPLAESTNQSTKTKTTTKKASTTTTKKSEAAAKKPAKTKVKKPSSKEQSASTSEESTALVVAPSTRRSTRTRAAPKSYY